MLTYSHSLAMKGHKLSRHRVASQRDIIAPLDSRGRRAKRPPQPIGRGCRDVAPLFVAHPHQLIGPSATCFGIEDNTRAMDAAQDDVIFIALLEIVDPQWRLLPLGAISRDRVQHVILRMGACHGTAHIPQAKLLVLRIVQYGPHCVDPVPLPRLGRFNNRHLVLLPRVDHLLHML